MTDGAQASLTIPFSIATAADPGGGSFVPSSQCVLKGSTSTRAEQRCHPLVELTNLLGPGGLIAELRFAPSAVAWSSKGTSYQAHASESEEQVKRLPVVHLDEDAQRWAEVGAALVDIAGDTALAFEQAGHVGIFAGHRPIIYTGTDKAVKPHMQHLPDRGQDL